MSLRIENKTKQNKRKKNRENHVDRIFGNIDKKCLKVQASKQKITSCVEILQNIVIFLTKASPAHIEQKASLIWFNKRPTFFMDQSYDLPIHKMLHLGPPWLLPADVVRKLSHLRFLSVRLHRLVLEELNRQARFCVPFCSWSTHTQNHQFINHLSFK